MHTVESVPAETQVIVYFEVVDVDETIRSLKKLGIEAELEPADQTWLWREAYLRDPAGNRICVYKAGRNRRYPPWRIEDDTD